MHSQRRHGLALALALGFGSGLCAVARAGVQPAWIVRYTAGLAHETNEVVAVALDPLGNIIVGGSSTGAAGDYDYLALKYAPDGHLLWSARYASVSNGNDRVRGMALDGEGAVCLTGTSATVKYSSNGVMEWSVPFAGRSVAVAGDGHVYVTGFSETDFATAKFSANGSNDWVRLKDFYGLKDRSDKIALDEAGNVFVAGGAEWQCEPRQGICYSRFEVVQYAPTGETVWASKFPPPPEDIMVFRAVTAIWAQTGKIYFCGRCDGPAGRTFYTARLDSQGSVDWTQDFVATSEEGASAMAVSVEKNVYVSGSRIYLVFPHVAYATYKADSAGARLWEAIYDNGGTPGVHRGKAMALDLDGNVYVTGASDNASGDADWATIKYSPDGKEQWVRRYDGPAHGVDAATAIAVDASGSVYVAGTQATTNGSTEVVLIKYVDLTNIALEEDGSVLLKFFGAPGQSCRFQASTDLSSWADIGSGLVDTGGIATFQETNPPVAATRFYRMVSP